MSRKKPRICMRGFVVVGNGRGGKNPAAEPLGSRLLMRAVGVPLTIHRRRA
jgi:hypothetical protein